jgi:hypothetical protein
MVSIINDNELLAEENTMSKNERILTAAVISLATILSLIASSCGTKSPAYITPPLGNPSTTATTPSPRNVPFLPAAYYRCISVFPIDLETAFYGLCWSDPNADATDDGQVFALKDLIVDAWTIKDVNNGWLWADQIKCPIININDAKALTLGNHVDIVGICVGHEVSQNGVDYLLFRDCYVLEANSVQLPAPGEGGAFNPSY